MNKDKRIERIIEELKELKEDEQAKNNVTERELAYIEQAVSLWKKRA